MIDLSKIKGLLEGATIRSVTAEANAGSTELDEHGDPLCNLVLWTDKGRFEFAPSCSSDEISTVDVLQTIDHGEDRIVFRFSGF